MLSAADWPKKWSHCSLVLRRGMYSSSLSTCFEYMRLIRRKIRCFCEVKMGNFWSHDSTRNGASSSCSCSYSATDIAFHQIDVDPNIEIIWGVCTLQSARNNILFAFPRAGKYKGKTRGAFKGPGLELLSLRPVFGLFSCLWLAATPLFFLSLLFLFDSIAIFQYGAIVPYCKKSIIIRENKRSLIWRMLNAPGLSTKMSSLAVSLVVVQKNRTCIRETKLGQKNRTC